MKSTINDKHYWTRGGFADGIGRAPECVFVRLTRNQVVALTRLAKASGKTLKDYLRDFVEAAIEKLIPAKGKRKKTGN
jgi:hypothetical protein